MSRKLIDRSPDLKRLEDEGYEIEIYGGQLLVHSVPYVTASKEVQRATLVSELTLSGDATRPPGTHVIKWTGSFPSRRDGREITALRSGEMNERIRDGLVARFSFSQKPKENGAWRDYKDYYEKITTYVTMISGPAGSLDPDATARTHKPIAASEEDSVFRYIDTASSRVGIMAVAEKLKALRIGIIGVGGTGSYVLDLVAKTHVREIHLFDDDKFHQHSAFRAPGAPSLEELGATPTKVAYFAALYSKMRRNIFPHECRINAETASKLDGLDFVFVCVDQGAARAAMFAELERRGIPFIDCGMAVHLLEERNELWGLLRVTTVTKKQKAARSRIPQGSAVLGNEYAENIQIAELNSITAAMAVLKWKKLFGCYQDLELEHHTTFSTNAHLLTSDVPGDGS